MQLVYNRKTVNAHVNSPFRRNFGFFCRNNIVNDFSFYTQDNKFIDIISTISMKTLIDINNKKIFLSRRQYSELKSLVLHSGESGKFYQIGSFSFVPFRLITIESQDSWLDVMEKLLDDEVLCRRGQSELITHVDKPLASNHLDISFIEFYMDHECGKPSDFRYYAMLNLLFSQVERNLHIKYSPFNNSNLDWDFSECVKNFVSKVITMIRRMDTNMDNRTLLLRIS